MALTVIVVDRHDERRGDDSQLDAMWSDSTARVFAVSQGKAEVVDGRLVSQLTSQVAVERPAESFYLGEAQDIHWFALGVQSDELGEDAIGLRFIADQLPPLDAELFTMAAALDIWHTRHQRCSTCGHPTTITHGGWVRVCRQEGTEYFPKVDPAVIMLITDDQDRALLGRRPAWPPGWYSTLAGFIEPGESAENCVVREVAEEAGVEVDPASVEFFGSQPWPFPSSLMLGFFGKATSSADPVVDGVEQEDAQWFSREQIASQCAAGELKMPPHFAIARHLIERWYGEALPGTWSRGPHQWR